MWAIDTTDVFVFVNSLPLRQFCELPPLPLKRARL